MGQQCLCAKVSATDLPEPQESPAPDEHAARFEELFAFIDADCSAGLEKSELLAFCRAAGLPDEGAGAAKVLEDSCDVDKDGKVTLEEWKAMFVKEQAKSPKAAEELLEWFEEINAAFSGQRFEEVFNVIDRDGSGALDRSELVAFWRADGLRDTGDVAAKVLESECDTDKDGKVTLTEWKAMFAAKRKEGPRAAAETLTRFEDIALLYLDQRIDTLFTKLDRTRRGWLDLKALLALSRKRKRSVNGLGSATATLLQEMCGTSADGRITAADWKAMFDKARGSGAPRKALRLLAGLEEVAESISA